MTAILCSVRVLQPYTANEDGELSLSPADVIQVLEKAETFWWFGRVTRTLAEGYFPSTYVEEIRLPPTPRLPPPPAVPLSVPKGLRPPVSLASGVASLPPAVAGLPPPLASLPPVPIANLPPPLNALPPPLPGLPTLTVQHATAPPPLGTLPPPISPRPVILPLPPSVNLQATRIAAAVKVQSTYRWVRMRRYFKWMRYCVVLIQSVWRGHRQRKKFKKLWQTRYLSQIQRPKTESLTHLSRSRPTAARARRPPTRRKQVAIATKTQTEARSSSGPELGSGGASESVSPRQPRVIRNLGGPSVLAFDPTAVTLKKSTAPRATAPVKPPSNPFANVSLRKTPVSTPVNPSVHTLQPTPGTRLRGSTGGFQMRRPLSQPLGTSCQSTAQEALDLPPLPERDDDDDEPLPPLPPREESGLLTIPAHLVGGERRRPNSMQITADAGLPLPSSLTTELEQQRSPRGTTPMVHASSNTGPEPLSVPPSSSGKHWEKKRSHVGGILSRFLKHRPDPEKVEAVVKPSPEQVSRSEQAADAHDKDGNTSLRGSHDGSEDDTHCHACSKKFSFTTRRHHCRGCKKSFCAKCSKHSVALPDLGTHRAVRVCNQCFTRATTAP
eukprot:CAMPEP_0177641138 /NCGR_PEP_ID=MMETSP0447-20121125/6911_1 /TAXON_ID=0 /ORGANISM="Stygamoeba regulata, Strain BSH-02190019" /LENGTH=610 /DNA_ID=CAMNT_0019143245 /DNA_START=36 /DNA_END=1868 /DNA_ORIENTATION=-